MYLNFKNVENFFTKSWVILLVLIHQVSSHSLANRTGKSPTNRKNDKFNRYFSNSFDDYSNRGSELRHSVDRADQKLNISLTVSNPFFNEFTEMQTQEPLLKEAAPSATEQPQCQCTCDPYQKANDIISEYVLNDNEDPDMDIDDNEELEKLKKPYKYIPMETIELAHQRPQRVTSTPPPPQNKFNNLVQSVTNYLTFPKLSTKEYLELGVSLVITGVLGFLGFSPFSPFPYQTFFKRSLLYNNRNTGYYNNFYQRQFNDTDDDPLSRIYHWIQSLD